MQNPTTKTQKIRNFVNNLIGLSKDQLNEHQKFREKLSGLLNLVDSSITSEESQTLTNSVLSSPKGVGYTKDIIACLTLRKISCRLKERFKKHAFYLLRSLFIETNRLNNLNKLNMKKRNKYQASGLGVKKLRLEIDLSLKQFVSVMRFFKRWEILVRLCKVKAGFTTPMVELLCTKLEKVQKFFFFKLVKQLYFDMILKRNIKLSVSSLNSIFVQRFYVNKLSTFHLLKILASKSRRSRLLYPLLKLSKLSNRLVLLKNFNEWYRQTTLIKRALWMQKRKTLKRTESSASSVKKSASSLFSSVSTRRYNSRTTSILPLPKNIHDYIDDIIETSQNQTLSYYFNKNQYINY